MLLTPSYIDTLYNFSFDVFVDSFLIIQTFITNSRNQKSLLLQAYGTNVSV